MIPERVLQLFDGLVAMRMGGQTANPLFEDLLRQLAKVFLSGELSRLPKLIPPDVPKKTAPIQELPTGGFVQDSGMTEINVTTVRPHNDGDVIFGTSNGKKFYCLWNSSFSGMSPLSVGGTYSVPTKTLKLIVYKGSDQLVPKTERDLSPREQSFYSYVSENYPGTDRGKKAGEKILEALQNSGPPDISSEVTFPPPGQKEN